MGKLNFLFFVVQRQHRASGIAKDKTDSFFFQALQYSPRSIHAQRDNPLYNITLKLYSPIIACFPLPDKTLFSSRRNFIQYLAFPVRGRFFVL